MQVWQVRTIISVININWNGFHSLSNIFIPSAKKNNFLANFGKFWQILGNFGKHFFWQTLANTFFGKLKKKGNILPKFAKNNFLANSGKLWQTLANTFFWQTQKKGNILPKFALPPPPPLSIPNFTYGLALIIPGNVKNSDLTMPKSTSKNRLADYLLELKQRGS